MKKIAAIELYAGIGDCVHIEPVLRHTLASGYDEIHIFYRQDAVGIYKEYPNVYDHPLEAKQLKMNLCRDGAVHVSVGDAEHNIPGLHRTFQYAQKICPALNIPMLEGEYPRPPVIPVTRQEKDWGVGYYKAAEGQLRVLFQIDSYRTSKSLNLPKANNIITLLLDDGYRVAVIAENWMNLARRKELKRVQGLHIRQLMSIAAGADVVIGMDSAPSWISLAVGTMTIVMFGATNPEHYGHDSPNCAILYSRDSLCTLCHSRKCNNRTCLDSISEEQIRCAVKGEQFPLHKMKISAKEHFGGIFLRERLPINAWHDTMPTPECYEPIGDTEPRSIALLRLDGLGGTITLSDQAKKIKGKYPSSKLTLIIRQYDEVFRNNPHVDKVICVGDARWTETLNIFKPQFDALADIRFSVARWYGSSVICHGSYYPELYYKFPVGQGILSDMGLHHIQLTDMQLAIPHETIDSEVFFELPQPELDKEYIVVSSGVDKWHKGLLQTKCWQHWDDLVPLLDKPAVQVGTLYDQPIKHTIDMRGMTDISELASLLKRAFSIIVTEGGLVHLAYALGCKSVIVLRGPTASPLLAYPGHTHIDSIPCRGCLFEKSDWFARCPMGMVKPVCMASIVPARVVNTYENLVAN